MRVSTKKLTETFETFEKDLDKLYHGKVRLWLTDPGLPNAIYIDDIDLIRGGNKTLWKWIFRQFYNNKGERK